MFLLGKGEFQIMKPAPDMQGLGKEEGRSILCYLPGGSRGMIRLFVFRDYQQVRTSGDVSGAQVLKNAPAASFPQRSG